MLQKYSDAEAVRNKTPRAIRVDKSKFRKLPKLKAKNQNTETDYTAANVTGNEESSIKMLERLRDKVKHQISAKKERHAAIKMH